MITTQPRWRPAPGPAGLGMLAGVLAALLLAFGPPGTDFAAHQHQTDLFAAHGFSIWDNSWYAGRYWLVTYSLLFYPLAVALGIRVVAAISVGVAAAAFAVLLRRRWGNHAIWASRSFVAVMAAFVLTAAFPFALGAALGLVALCALQARRWRPSAVLVLATLASSPLAFLLLALAVVAIAIGDRPGRRWISTAVPIVGVIGVLELGLTLLFGSHTRDPFSTKALLPAVAFGAGLSAWTWRVPGARVLTVLGALYGLTCLFVFEVPSNIGEGITRLRLVALPLALLAGSLRSWRPRGLAVLLIAGVGWFTVAPDVRSLTVGIGDESSRAAYWAPAVAFLHTRSSPSYRTEVVDTAHHWAAAYLPAVGLPIVRGWFRQDDFPLDRVLYEPLSRIAYQHWLRSLGVKYVVLTDATPDFSAEREAALLQSGRSGLQPVLVTRHLTIFAVPAPRGIVTGPGSPWIRALGQESVDLVAPHTGTLRVAVRSSPYWHTSTGCLTKGADGLLRLRVTRPGPVRLHIAVDRAALAESLPTQDATPAPCAVPESPPEDSSVP